MKFFKTGLSQTRIITFFLILAFLLPGRSWAEEVLESASGSSLAKLFAGEKYIYDSYGRIVLLRGANVPACYQYPFPYEEQDLAVLKSFGFNFIRLCISWSYAEPKEGEYNQEYLESLLNFIRSAGKFGIYVMPDVHQAGWGAPGSGIPSWLCERCPKNISDLLQIAKETHRFWRSPELQEKLIRFWKYLGENFRGEENIFGYNILNEPVSLDCLFYGRFEKKLFPFYEKTISALRALDPEKPIIVEPCVSAVMFPSKTRAFSQANLVYSTHPYFVHLYTGKGKLIVVEREPNWELSAKYQRHLYEAEQMKAPLLIGEYGGPRDRNFVRKWLEQNLALQDRYFLSSAIWVYFPPDKNWSIVDASKKPVKFYWELVHRPYPRYTSGIPIQLYFSATEKKFLYRFQPDPKIQAPSEIYLPRELMNHSSLKVSAKNWTYDEKEELLFLSNEGAGKEIAVELK